MEKVNPVRTPLDPGIALEANLDGNVGDWSNSYMRLIGELQFLMKATQPNITFTISQLSCYTVNPMMQHISALKHVLHYLLGTRLYGITYNNILGHPNYFFSYANASFASTDDLKLITGYIFMMASGTITWFSKKQSITTMSTTEAKYIALSKAACKARWLRNLFSELGFAQTLPTMI